MSKAELIASIRSEREKLQAVLAGAAPEDMTIGGVVGEWSIKDVLAHIAMWYSRAITVLFQAERGIELQLPKSNAPDWSDVNAKDYRSQKDRPLDRIWRDFQDAHRQLLKRLEAWQDEAALFDRHRYPELGGRSLAEFVRANSSAHEAEHRVQIETWLAQRGRAPAS